MAGEAEAAAAAAAAAGAGAGADKGGGAAEPFYKSWNLDADGVKFIEDRKFDGPAIILKSAIESDRLARSRNVFEKPDPQKLNEWKGWTELGWKPDIKDYTLADPKDWPKGMVLDKQLQEETRKLAHELRIPHAAAQGLYEGMGKYFLKRIEETTTAGAAKLKAADDALTAKWGADRPRNEEQARRAAKALGVNVDEMSAIEQSIGTARFLELFHGASAGMGEERLQDAGAETGGMPSSAAAIEAEINRLQSDPTFLAALNDPRHAQRTDLLAKRQGLIDRLAKLQSRAA